MAGKTHFRHCRVIFDEVDLSGDAQQISSFGASYDREDVTGLSAGVHHFELGQPRLVFDGFQATFNNAAGGAYSELKDREEYILTMAIGDRAAPILGDNAFLFSAEQLSFEIQASQTGAGVITISVEHSDTDADHEKPFGKVLCVGTSRVATYTSSSIDNGASSANGALAHLHIVASDGGTWEFKIQDSPNDSTWADLITFAADGSAVAAERGDVAGTVDRYLRAVLTRTSGTVSAWISIARQ